MSTDTKTQTVLNLIALIKGTALTLIGDINNKAVEPLIERETDAIFQLYYNPATNELTIGRVPNKNEPIAVKDSSTQFFRSTSKVTLQSNFDFDNLGDFISAITESKDSETYYEDKARCKSYQLFGDNLTIQNVPMNQSIAMLDSDNKPIMDNNRPVYKKTNNGTFYRYNILKSDLVNGLSAMTEYTNADDLEAARSKLLPDGQQRNTKTTKKAKGLFS